MHELQTINRHDIQKSSLVHIRGDDINFQQCVMENEIGKFMVRNIIETIKVLRNKWVLEYYFETGMLPRNSSCIHVKRVHLITLDHFELLFILRLYSIGPVLES